MANLQIVPAGKKVEAQYVEMMVPLYSYGCEKKVKKALAHLRGIHSVHVDYELQKVTVWGICNKEDVLATIKKKRREARFWEQKEVNESAEIEAKNDMDEDQEASQGTINVAVPSRSFKFRKSWKRLLPTLVLY
ncbi:Copper chaperone domain-containing protein [Dioscorea alata]|uniref:Copper chaperone domain-containing protein n=1 Tax=Dioscorea alata TaxID=55571 RepID=A0ACB7UV06_DIOAL|nr:Copper chaperone domain-containing protein [Dioscorea alata]